VSDFLSNLVTRSLNREQAIRPYVASLFEPTRESGPAVPVDLEPEVEVAAAGERTAGSTDVAPTTVASRRSTLATSGPILPLDASTRVAEPAMVSRPRSPAPVVPQTPDESAEGGPEGPAVLAPKASLELATTQTLRHPAADQPSPWLTRGTEGSPPQREPQRATRPTVAPLVREVVGERRLETSRPAASPEPPAVGTPTPGRTSRENADEASWAGPTRSGVESLSGPKPTPVIVRPLVRPVPEGEAMARPGTKPDTEAPGPTIQVTIGRVEVRAVSEPPPQQQERPQPSVMSLDEYLRLRANGGER
jgi:hypothetical protein